MHTERRSPCVLKWRITCRRPVIVDVIQTWLCMRFKTKTLFLLVTIAAAISWFFMPLNPSIEVVSFRQQQSQWNQRLKEHRIELMNCGNGTLYFLGNHGQVLNFEIVEHDERGESSNLVYDNRDSNWIPLGPGESVVVKYPKFDGTDPTRVAFRVQDWRGRTAFAGTSLSSAD